jgi:hypothetical protein
MNASTKGHPRKGVQRTAMRAAGATYHVALRHFRHRGLDVSHWHGPNRRSAFVADDAGLVAVDLYDETSATVGSQRFVQYDWTGRADECRLLRDAHSSLS